MIRERKGATDRNVGVLHRVLEGRGRGAGSGPAGKGRIRAWALRLLILYLLAGFGTTLVDRVPLSEAGWEGTSPLPSSSTDFSASKKPNVEFDFGAVAR